LVKAEVSRAVARRIHSGQLTRLGEPLMEHVERVAVAVPANVRGIAYLHDVLERSDRALEELRELGLTDTELATLTLLTRRPHETYRVYVMRIARANGKPGRIARAIKLADLDDHLCHRPFKRAPAYGWARERILASQLAHGETRAPSSAPARRVA
jgi:hypothetical protein